MRREFSGTSRISGFTLLEILVALTVFSILAGTAYGSLSALLKWRDSITAQEQGLAAVQTAVTRIEKDLHAIVNRPIHSTGRQERAAIWMEGDRMQWVRGGRLNVRGLKRSQLEKVRIFFDDNSVKRWSWHQPDARQSATPAEVVLLEGVTRLQWRLLYDGAWLLQWPPPGQTEQQRWPAAVEFTLDTETYGVIRRVVELPAGNWQPYQSDGNTD